MNVDEAKPLRNNDEVWHHQIIIVVKVVKDVAPWVDTLSVHFWSPEQWLGTTALEFHISAAAKSFEHIGSKEKFFEKLHKQVETKVQLLS